MLTAEARPADRPLSLHAGGIEAVREPRPLGLGHVYAVAGRHSPMRDMPGEGLKILLEAAPEPRAQGWRASRRAPSSQASSSRAAEPPTGPTASARVAASGRRAAFTAATAAPASSMVAEQTARR